MPSASSGDEVWHWIAHTLCVPDGQLESAKGVISHREGNIYWTSYTNKCPFVSWLIHIIGRGKHLYLIRTNSCFNSVQHTVVQSPSCSIWYPSEKWCQRHARLWALHALTLPYFVTSDNTSNTVERAPSLGNIRPECDTDTLKVNSRCADSNIQIYLTRLLGPRPGISCGSVQSSFARGEIRWGGNFGRNPYLA